MPTYSNTGSRVLVIGNPPRTFAPGDTGFESVLILDHLDGVVRTADTPRFNLLSARHDVPFAGAETKTVVLADPHQIKTVLITTDVQCDLYFGAADNVPAIRINPGDYALATAGVVESLVFSSAAAGQVVVGVVGQIPEGVTWRGSSLALSVIDGGGA